MALLFKLHFNFSKLLSQTQVNYLKYVIPLFLSKQLIVLFSFLIKRQTNQTFIVIILKQLVHLRLCIVWHDVIFFIMWTWYYLSPWHFVYSFPTIFKLFPFYFGSGMYFLMTLFKNVFQNKSGQVSSFFKVADISCSS